ncbi:flagellar filament capping protein FliD [Niameybacter massiliensis]|uniref:Flagellar hook-associated protein 2 n=1 Tax=Holtiella tumoricola TaxID=3018743 RepID=A0AA42DPD2_9FIRM|nr:flagellar filament capping protein FliD [Holtiella tumoricola]MDA3732313.1 flagellar filament capping protein FliD [Holtiella tumoricola]
MRTTSIKFTGMASGLDTESIVKSMIAPYQMKVDSKWQQQTLMEMQKNAWRDMNKQIFDFHDKYISKMRLESTFNKKNISLSNPSIITIDKNATLPVGTHTIDRIDQLAEGARITSKAISDIDTTKKLSEQDGYKDLVGKKITINGKEIEITEEHTISSLAKEMQQVDPNINVNFDTNTKAFFISSKKTGESHSIALGGDKDVWNKLGILDASTTALKIDTTKDTTLTIKGKAISISAGETHENIITQLEAALNDGVIDDKDKSKVIYRDGKFIVGAKQKDISIIGDGIQKENISIGKNAILSYNGVEINSEANNISVNGANFIINTITKDPITLVATQDTDAIVDFMKEFVTEYNKLIEDIHNKLDAASSKSYKPLTSEQKKEMSEYEIEAWDKKIKDGIFRKDPDLKYVVDSMREVLSGVVEGGTFSSLSEIGISTGDWKEKGKLHFDEDKFRKALAKDTDGVIQLIAGSGDPKSVFEKDLANGVISSTKSWEELKKSELENDKALVAKYENRTKSIGDRLYDSINNVSRSTTLRSAYSFYNDKALDKKITVAKDDVKKLEERMYRMEDMYYKRFMAMEKMMQKLNSQSSWLTSQMG